MGSIPAIQLAHAGRKGICKTTMERWILFDSNAEKLEEKPWKPIAPSSIALIRWLANPKSYVYY